MIPRNAMISIWRELMEWYLKRCRYWGALAKLKSSLSDNEEEFKLLDMAYGLWGCVWHEHDLVLVFCHKLLKYIENNDLELHLHIGYKLKPANFSVMKEFYRKLSESVKWLRGELKLGKKWFPEIDLIVARDDPPFEHCFEFKYYHYLPTTWNVIEDLRRKIVVLNTLKMFDVCKDVVLVVLDDAICRKNKILCSKLKKLLGDANKYIMVLSHYVSYNELRAVLMQYSTNNVS